MSDRGGHRQLTEMSQNYTRTAVALHWLVAVLIACGFVLGTTMADLPFSPRKLRLESYHKWIGMTVLALVIVRGCWRLRHRAPPMAPMPPWQALTAKVTHFLLYALIVAIPILGWSTSSAAGYPVVYLGLWRLPDLAAKDKHLAELLGSVHANLAWILFYVVLLHTGAALKHHFVDRDDTLRRMLRWRRAQ